MPTIELTESEAQRLRDFAQHFTPRATSPMGILATLAAKLPRPLVVGSTGVENNVTEAAKLTVLALSEEWAWVQDPKYGPYTVLVKDITVIA